MGECQKSSHTHWSLVPSHLFRKKSRFRTASPIMSFVLGVLHAGLIVWTPSQELDWRHWDFLNSRLCLTAGSPQNSSPCTVEYHSWRFQRHQWYYSKRSQMYHIMILATKTLCVACFRARIAPVGDSRPWLSEVFAKRLFVGSFRQILI